VLAYAGASSSAMTARTPNRFSSAARHPRRRRALAPTDARRGCWRCTVSPFFSRSHEPRPRRLIAADEGQASPAPPDSTPGRAISTRIASSCTGSRRRRGRPCRGAPASAQTSDAERRAELIMKPSWALEPALSATLNAPPVPL
jgi:hypothetical protein